MAGHQAGDGALDFVPQVQRVGLFRQRHGQAEAVRHAMVHPGQAASQAFRALLQHAGHVSLLVVELVIGPDDLAEVTSIMQNQNPGCLAAIGRLFGLRQTRTDSYAQELPYLLRDDFLSAAELSFFQVVKDTLAGQFLVFPKVSLADIFFVSRPDINVHYYNKIGRKHVDFLLCSPDTLKPVLAIELDDTTHARPSRAERDAFVDEVFETAGLPLLHVPARLAYNTSELDARIRGMLGEETRTYPSRTDGWTEAWRIDQEPPFCPKCGTRMVLRTAQRGQLAGRRFYGCANYPRCKEIIPISG